MVFGPKTGVDSPRNRPNPRKPKREKRAAAETTRDNPRQRRFHELPLTDPTHYTTATKIDMSKIKLTDCLWVRSLVADREPFKPLTQALEVRGCRSFSLQIKSDPYSLSKLKQLLWKTDDHVILYGLWGKEYRKVQPILQQRKNFSLMSIDWWNTPFWFTQNAEYVLFNFYSGIVARTQGARFANDWNPPLFSLPERMFMYEFACAALRPAAVLALPYLNWRARQLRAQDTIRPEKMIYIPIPITAKNLPFEDEQPEYDFCNVSTTAGFWVIRDPYAAAKYNFVNLYADRQRLFNLIQKFEGKPYKVFDRRRFREILPWETYCSSIRRSRFAISTGGLHQAAVPKFLEYACFGTPMIGSKPRYDFPWLDQCLFPVDAMNLTEAELKGKLEEAFALQPKLRQNCLNLRETLLRMYDALRLLDLAQEQIDGKPIPPGYVREQVPG